MIVSSVLQPGDINAKIVGRHYRLLRLEWNDYLNREHYLILNGAEARQIQKLLNENIPSIETPQRQMNTTTPHPKTHTIDIRRAASGVFRITLASTCGVFVPVHEQLPPDCNQITLILTATEAEELADKIDHAILDANPHNPT